MPLRVLIAYAIIAALALGAFALLWFKLLRHQLAQRRGRRRYRDERKLMKPPVRPVAKTG